MKTLIFSKYNQLATLLLGTLITGILLMFRIKITQSFYLLFLVWNLFLAMIPYSITFFMQLKPDWFTSRLTKGLAFLIWLLFLPNAPYLISDFTHLQWTAATHILLDTTIITSFAALGLLYMAYSIQDMKRMLTPALSRKQNTFLTLGLCLLLGFGIYLGRYLRWNSWDIIQEPLQLLTDVSQLVIHPMQHQFAWMVTLTYAAISWLAIHIIQRTACVH